MVLEYCSSVTMMLKLFFLITMLRLDFSPLYCCVVVFCGGCAWLQTLRLTESSCGTFRRWTREIAS